MFIAIAVIAFTARLAAAQPDPHTSDDASARDDVAVSEDIAASEDIAVSEDIAASATPSASPVAEREAFDPEPSDTYAADDRETARPHPPTRIGRVDLTITWRRTARVQEVDAIAGLLDPMTSTRGVVWLLLTWSR